MSRILDLDLFAEVDTPPSDPAAAIRYCGAGVAAARGMFEADPIALLVPAGYLPHWRQSSAFQSEEARWRRDHKVELVDGGARTGNPFQAPPAKLVACDAALAWTDQPFAGARERLEAEMRFRLAKAEVAAAMERFVEELVSKKPFAALSEAMREGQRALARDAVRRSRRRSSCDRGGWQWLTPPAPPPPPCASPCRRRATGRCRPIATGRGCWR
jgi:hypothetical protein